MAGIAEGEHQAHGQGRDAAGRDRRDRLTDVGLVEGRDDLTGGVDAFGDLEAVGAGDDRVGHDVLERVELLTRPGQAGDLDDVAEPAGADHRDPGTGALQCDVRRHRRFMTEEPQVSGVLIPAEGAHEPVDDGSFEVLRVGRDLVLGDLTVLVDDHDVGEGAPDVDSSALHTSVPSSVE
ncbi:hypothetical protein JCM18882A_25160 [Brevibacterium metallidurans]|uniref:Uncharacterized protein n=1 Tax=Brevibacterium metallidurans TaxID=1482676 RepID=A0ABN0SQ80_9MICO